MNWKLFAGAGALALAGFLGWLLISNMRADAYKAGELAERDKWRGVEKAMLKDQTDQALDFAQQQTGQAERYAASILAQEPVILRSINEVIKYETTPAGRAACLPAERVLGIEADAATLIPAPPASASGARDAVPAHADAGAK